jgi:phosphatidylserine/phosphatidylglycerophosphate/cardiolipin synthase-like enzyme
VRAPILILFTGLLLAPFPTGAESGESQVEIAFSPVGDAEALVLKVIGRARESIHLAAYSFTSRPVAEALVAAHRRGVAVQAVLDESQESGKYTGATFLVHAGIAVRIDRRHAIMHNKYLVVDGRHVETGSFNFTRAAAQKNAENVLVLWNNPQAARDYLGDWRTHWDHAEPYDGR